MAAEKDEQQGATQGGQPLLAADEPPAFTVEHADGSSPYVIACDHAGNRLPRRLGRLGLAEAELQRHIAWDIGAGAVAGFLATELDAFLIRQTYSRLVIDCNRSPDVPTSIAPLSEMTPIPGNFDLPDAERRARLHEIFQPYHRRLAAELDRRRGRDQPTLLLALHSFTPVFKGIARPWHCGLLYHRDVRLARILAELFRAEAGLIVGDNQPYAITDDSDYTIPTHGEGRGLPHIEFEMRQDLIADEAGQRRWAERLAQILPEAYRRLASVGTP